MAWHQTVDKPLSEPVLTQLADAYMSQQDSRWQWSENGWFEKKCCNEIALIATENFLNVILLVMLTKSNHLFTQWLDSKETMMRHFSIISMS